MRFGLIVAAVGACLLIAGLALVPEVAESAIVEPVRKNVTVALRRGSTNITTAAIAEACAKVKCTLPSLAVTVANCPAVKAMLIDADGLTRTIGSNVYQCVVSDQSIVRFQVAPIAQPPIDCVVGEWGPWSDPPWLACADGQQTRALIHSRTILTQPANGGAVCPALVETVPEARPCPSVVELSWGPSIRNVDGTALTNLAGYRISYGTSPGALVQTVQLANPGITRYALDNLAPGAYYFAVRAYTSNGTESDLSNVAQKIVP